ncbi:hypothetical protein Tsubulata_009688, partial [Turnera subulata]
SPPTPRPSRHHCSRTATSSFPSPPLQRSGSAALRDEPEPPTRSSPLQHLDAASRHRVHYSSFSFATTSTRRAISFLLGHRSTSRLQNRCHASTVSHPRVVDDPVCMARVAG